MQCEFETLTEIIRIALQVSPYGLALAEHDPCQPILLGERGGKQVVKIDLTDQIAET
jgi:hypothetical protein